MSQREKKKSAKSKICLGIGIISILIVVLLVLLGIKLFNRGDYYKVESRIDKVKESGKINDEYNTAGWLKVQGTDIDMPIIYTKTYSNEFPMELEEFAWTLSSDDKFHNMNRIVGHNLYNLSAKPKISSDKFHRLEELMAFVYYDFAKDNKYIQYTVDGKDYVYKIFSVSFIDEKQYFYSLNDYPKDVMKDTIKLFKEESMYDYKVDVREDDKIISLSTCTRFFGQDRKANFYVAGRLLREDEKIDNYKVVKNKNYKKVEKILKGDDNDGDDDTL